MSTLPLAFRDLLLNVVVAGRAAPGTQGRYMGVCTMVFGIAFVVAPAAGTYIYDHRGAATLWIVVGLAGVPLWIGSVWIGKMLKRDPVEERRLLSG